MGDLPDSELEKIESWYFADGQRVDEVWAVFSEIAEEYMSGGLSVSESRRFDQRLNSAPALFEMFEFEKALFNNAARTASKTSRRNENDISISFPERRRSARFGFHKASWLAVAGIIVLTALIGWIALRKRENAITSLPKDSEQAVMERQKSTGAIVQPTVDPQHSPPAGSDANSNEEKNSSKTPPSRQVGNAAGIDQEVTATFLLSRSMVREAQNSPTLEITDLTSVIQLELELPDDVCSVYSAGLYTESGESLQRWQRLKPRRDNSIRRVRLRMPANSMKIAKYIIRLECISHSIPEEQYLFKIEKKI